MDGTNNIVIIIIASETIVCLVWTADIHGSISYSDDDTLSASTCPTIIDGSGFLPGALTIREKGEK